MTNGWRERYEHVYACLDGEQRRRVLSSIQNSVLEGFEPTEADIRVMVRLELGEITSLEAMADVATCRGLRPVAESPESNVDRGTTHGQAAKCPREGSR